jgi:hypothetical protein
MGAITDGLWRLGVGCGLSYQGGTGRIQWFKGVASRCRPLSVSALGEGQRSLGRVAHCDCQKGENATIGVVLYGFVLVQWIASMAATVVLLMVLHAVDS